MKMNELEIKTAAREFLVENWEAFRVRAKEQGLDSDYVDSEQFDEDVDNALLS